MSKHTHTVWFSRDVRTSQRHNAFPNSFSNENLILNSALNLILNLNQNFQLLNTLFPVWDLNKRPHKHNKDISPKKGPHECSCTDTPTWEQTTSNNNTGNILSGGQENKKAQRNVAQHAKVNRMQIALYQRDVCVCYISRRGNMTAYIFMQRGEQWLWQQSANYVHFAACPDTTSSKKTERSSQLERRVNTN